MARDRTAWLTGLGVEACAAGRLPPVVLRALVSAARPLLLRPGEALGWARLVRPEEHAAAVAIHREPRRWVSVRPVHDAPGQAERAESVRTYTIWSVADATVVGASSVVALDPETVTCDLVALDAERKFRYTDPSLVAVCGERAAIRRPRDASTLADGIFLGGNYSFNFYHFVIEYLAKLPLLRRVDVPPGVPLLVDDVVHRVPQLAELLGALDRGGRPVVYLEPHRRYRVRRLVLLPTLSLVPPNYRRSATIAFTDTRLDPESLLGLRAALGRHASGRGGWPVRVHLSRSQASGRRQANEAEVAAVLARHGFVAVRPESLSVADQIDLFASAEIVAGVGGAAFTNLIHCRPGARALCLVADRTEFSAFSTIASIVGVDLRYLAASEAPETARTLQRPFRMDPGRLDRALGALVERAPPGDVHG